MTIYTTIMKTDPPIREVAVTLEQATWQKSSVVTALQNTAINNHSLNKIFYV